MPLSRGYDRERKVWEFFSEIVNSDLVNSRAATLCGSKRTVKTPEPGVFNEQRRTKIFLIEAQCIAHELFL